MRFIGFTSLAIATGAGLASALLFASLIGGGPLALPLFITSPLPIAIAALGWGGPVGWVATASATLGVGFGLGWHAAMVLLLCVGMPIPLTVRLIGLARPVDADGRLEWYPLGRALTALAGFVALGTIIGGWAIGFDVEETARETAAAAQTMMGPGTDPARVEAFVRLTVALMPLVFPASWMLVSVFDLWLAAKIVAHSGRLSRPPEDPALIEVSPIWGTLFLAAIAGTFLGGWLASVAAVVAGVLFALHFLVGMGVLTVAVRGTGMKVFLLAVAWGLIFLFTVPALVVALAGLLEPWAGLRRRLAAPTRRP
jgi:hypothetical protein